jgi:transposase-like protein
MTKGRKTTHQERTEIVAFCIEHGKNYPLTIEKYGVSYQQIYSWVRKYEEKGIDGLADKRGRTKTIEEMTDIEKLRAENRILQAKNLDLEIENAFIKKLKELEEGGH